MEIFAEAGEPAVYARIRALTADLVDLLIAEGWELRIADEAHRSGIILVRHPDAASAVTRLAERNVVVDHRAGYVRVSPHFYNTPDENRHFAQLLREV